MISLAPPTPNTTPKGDHAIKQYGVGKYIIIKGECKMIKVKNDWTWVVERVNRELNGNTELEEKVYQYMDEKNIDLDRVKEMYQDGIEHGEENGKYLTFENWFNEFTN